MVPTVETYSIEESFLNLGEFNGREVEPLARELRDRVHRWVGIPTCVGIAPTKTLAKVANFNAKKRPQYRGVCDLRSSRVRAELLPTVPVEEVWGIGGASAAKLAKLGILTAADLAALEPDDARALMTVTGGRTVYELRGISCMPLELMEPTRTNYALALNELSAFCKERQQPVSRTLILEFRAALLDAELSPSTVNLKLSTIRKLVQEAKRAGVIGGGSRTDDGCSKPRNCWRCRIALRSRASGIT